MPRLAFGNQCGKSGVTTARTWIESQGPILTSTTNMTDAADAAIMCVLLETKSGVKGFIPWMHSMCALCADIFL